MISKKPGQIWQMRNTNQYYIVLSCWLDDIRPTLRVLVLGAKAGNPHVSVWYESLTGGDICVSDIVCNGDRKAK